MSKNGRFLRYDVYVRGSRNPVWSYKTVTGLANRLGALSNSGDLLYVEVRSVHLTQKFADTHHRVKLGYGGEWHVTDTYGIPTIDGPIHNNRRIE